MFRIKFLFAIQLSGRYEPSNGYKGVSGRAIELTRTFATLPAMKFPVAAIALLLAVYCLAEHVQAQPSGITNSVSPDQVIVLWPEGAPGALGRGSNDTPTLSLYLPKPNQGTGAAMIVCPGGAYHHLSKAEGEDYARWLNEQGIAAFVLKYRLSTNNYHYPAQWQDVVRSMRLVRARAAEWKLDSKRIGIMGSSAGGHLASTLMTHFDSGKPDDADPIERQSSRPDLGVLCYAVITMGEHTHRGSHDNLLGKNPSPELVQELSNELHVTAGTPPCFIWQTETDTVASVENSLDFAAALRKAKIPFELHIYQEGKHGQGLGGKEYDSSKWLPWTGECRAWLQKQGFGR